jgi:hypothetical protein
MSFYFEEIVGTSATKISGASTPSSSTGTSIHRWRDANANWTPKQESL